MSNNKAGGAGAWVAVGRVGRSHGLDGSFVVEEASDAPERLAAGAVVHVGGEAATVVEAKRAGGRVVIRLDTRVRRGAQLEVRRSDLPALGPDSYYVFQLIGLSVVREDSERLGSVIDVEPGVANDVLALDTGIRLPLVEDCVTAIDIEGGRIVIAEGFVDPG